MPAQTALNEITKVIRSQLPFLRTRYNVNTVEVFGSYVHGDQKTTSDLDVLISFSEPPGLLEFVEIENYLGDVLGVKVDLVMKDALRPHIGKRILEEAVPV